MTTSIWEIDWLIAGSSEVDDSDIPEHQAADISSRIIYESLYAAQHVIGYAPASRGDVFKFAAIHAQTAATIFAGREVAAALRAMSPEIAGAVGGVSADIGAAITLIAEQALKVLANDNNNG